MCKQHTLYFNCGHRIHNRVSTCNGHKTYPTGDLTVRADAACLGHSYMWISLPGSCSACLRATAEADIHFAAETQRLALIDLTLYSTSAVDQPAVDLDLDLNLDESGSDLDEWKADRLAALAHQLPGCRFELHGRPAEWHSRAAVSATSAWQSRKKSHRTASLLSREVTPEQIVGGESWETRLVGSDESATAVPAAAASWAWGGKWDDDDADEDGDSTGDDSGDSVSEGSDDSVLDAEETGSMTEDEESVEPDCFGEIESAFETAFETFHGDGVDV